MRLFSGISGRLLVLTIVVVMVVEVVIFVPSVAVYRYNFLKERLVRAEIAALTVMTAPGGRPDEKTARELRGAAGALSVAIARDGVRMLVLQEAEPRFPTASFNLGDNGLVTLIVDALECLVYASPGDVQRAYGRTVDAMYDRVEFTFEAHTLKRAMLDYGERILWLSLLISVVTASVVFVAVRHFVVAPLLDVVGAVQHFHDDPEDAARVLRPTGRGGEVGEAEAAIAGMQAEVLRALAERRRLAQLGEAVAKINHDLRNMLAAGQLMTDRLGHSADPMVRRVLPKLVASLDRAVTLCTGTLDFGRAEERPPERRANVLATLLEDVVEGLGLAAMPEAPPPKGTTDPSGPGRESPADSTAAAAEDRGARDPSGATPPADPGARTDTAPRLLAGDATVQVYAAIGTEAVVLADPDQLYRVLSNLLRNAVEAIRTSGRSGSVTVSARRAPAAAIDAALPGMVLHAAGPPPRPPLSDPSEAGAGGGSGNGPSVETGDGTDALGLPPAATGARADPAAPGSSQGPWPGQPRPGRNGSGHALGPAPPDWVWWVEISDTGRGLPEKALANLFRPFAGGVRRGGTGLGLAIAAELAALQDGRLFLVSTSSAGTAFAIALRPNARPGLGSGAPQAPVAGVERVAPIPSNAPYPDTPSDTGTTAAPERPTAARK